MEKMTLWNAVKQPPKEALKQIKGGRLKGMTDINPQWRLQVMTEQFGPCGSGWSYSIDRIWTEPGSDGQVCAFALVSVKAGSDSVPGIGGSMLVVKESGGLHTNDEAYKMAVTDALSVALKAMGVAADVYAGKWDGSKYATDEQEVISDEQFNTLHAIIQENGIDLTAFLNWIGAESLDTIKAADFKKAKAALEAKAKADKK